MHERTDLLREFLGRCGNLYSRRYFLGDFMDMWHDTPEDAARTALCIKELLEDPRNTLLWGNHDVVDHDDDQIPFVIKTFGTSTPLRDLTYPVTHMDVHPTVEAWFGLPLTPGLDGHVQGVAP